MGDAPALSFTHIGTATILIEIDGFRLLTDPVFGRPPASYRFGWGTGSRHVVAPALSLESLGHVDAVLLSHDQHADNLDPVGRAVLEGRPVFTTPAAARRIGKHAVGLRTFQTVEPEGLPGLRITGTPARHGPPGCVPFAGSVTGFLIERPRSGGQSIYISGDTVWYRGMRKIARRFTIGYCILHMGAAGFRAWGPLRFTMSSAGAIKAIRQLNPTVTLPVHYSGWTHFRESTGQARLAFTRAGLDEKVHWLIPGHPTQWEPLNE